MFVLVPKSPSWGRAFARAHPRGGCCVAPSLIGMLRATVPLSRFGVESSGTFRVASVPRLMPRLCAVRGSRCTVRHDPQGRGCQPVSAYARRAFQRQLLIGIPEEEGVIIIVITIDAAISLHAHPSSDPACMFVRKLVEWDSALLHLHGSHAAVGGTADSFMVQYNEQLYKSFKLRGRRRRTWRATACGRSRRLSSRTGPLALR